MCAIAAPELAQYCAHMVPNGPLADPQGLADLAVGEAAGNERKDLDLARGELSSLLARSLPAAEAGRHLFGTLLPAHKPIVMAPSSR